MAVIIQRVVGSRHEDRFYPDLSGTLRTHNFYPVPPMKAGDGIARLALGLGEAVVGGDRALTFCPRYPAKPIQFTTPQEILRNSQTEFYAVHLAGGAAAVDSAAAPLLVRHDLEVARRDGKLKWTGSTWSPENEAVYDGTAREGVPLVTFAPILKQGRFPLAPILEFLMEIGVRALNMPVEIEFAVNLDVPEGTRPEFAFLQLRPFAVRSGAESLDLDALSPSRLLCTSRMTLGDGVLDGIHDVVLVDRATFDRSQSRVVAQAVAERNAWLLQQGTPYLLIGVGRWGCADPWLGIPVTWPQICGARAIVEADLKDLPVTPSQGSHFFQNLTSSGVGYFTVGGTGSGDGFLDWDWLRRQPALFTAGPVRHLKFERPLEVILNGRRGEGAILKPAAS